MKRVPVAADDVRGSREEGPQHRGAQRVGLPGLSPTI